jgi:hypothetical protein
MENEKKHRMLRQIIFKKNYVRKKEKIHVCGSNGIF